jgi:hypothetical protein
MEVGALQPLQEIGILELLEQDSRPTFIIDLHSSDTDVKGHMNVVFFNKSLRFFDDFRSVVYTETLFPAPSSSSNASTDSPQDLNAAAAQSGFKSWATTHTEDGSLPRHTFRGMYWVCFTLKNRWRVVSASQIPNQPRQSCGTPRSSRFTLRSTTTSVSSVSGMPDTDSLHSKEPNLSKQLADIQSPH